jgi:hypothetical protein
MLIGKNNNKIFLTNTLLLVQDQVKKKIYLLGLKRIVGLLVG